MLSDTGDVEAAFASPLRERFSLLAHPLRAKFTGQLGEPRQRDFGRDFLRDGLSIVTGRAHDG